MCMSCIPVWMGIARLSALASPFEFYKVLQITAARGSSVGRIGSETGAPAAERLIDRRPAPFTGKNGSRTLIGQSTKDGLGAVIKLADIKQVRKLK